jgi:hypothetical protein
MRPASTSRPIQSPYLSASWPRVMAGRDEPSIGVPSLAMWAYKASQADASVSAFLGPLARILRLPPARVTQALRAASKQGWGLRTDAPRKSMGLDLARCGRGRA